MKIRLHEIPPEGLSLEFALDICKLNERLLAEHELHKDSIVSPPKYVFVGDVLAKVEVTLQATTVELWGTCASSFRVPCSRCAEETEKALEVPFRHLLKPLSGRVLEEEEDVSLSYYSEDEINCAPILEEALLLALPYAPLCIDDCKGLCLKCGVDLNNDECVCKKEAFVDERFSKLEDLKIKIGQQN